MRERSDIPPGNPWWSGGGVTDPDLRAVVEHGLRGAAWPFSKFTGVMARYDVAGASWWLLRLEYGTFLLAGGSVREQERDRVRPYDVPRRVARCVQLTLGGGVEDALRFATHHVASQIQARLPVAYRRRAS